MVSPVLLSALREHFSSVWEEMYQGSVANRVPTLDAEKNFEMSSEWRKLFQKAEINTSKLKKREDFNMQNTVLIYAKKMF